MISNDDSFVAEPSFGEEIQLISSEQDKLYGIKRKTNHGYQLGSANLRFLKDKIYVNNKSYPRTQGLQDLILTKNPQNYSRDDESYYGQILEECNAHRLNNDPNGKIKKHSNSWKYYNIIKPLFELKTGTGLLPRYKIAQRNLRKDFVYWDDPNELVERLQLLIAERSAGNHNHENEIHSIIEELREAGYI